MAFRASAIITEIRRGPTIGFPTPGPGFVDLTPVALIPPRIGLRELAFDGLMSLGHDTSIGLTSYPAEVGADLFDHSYRNPNAIRMVGGVSLLADAAPLTAWALIQQLMASLRLLTISTNYGSYTNMILTNANALEDKDTQGTLMATLEFKELILSNAEGSSFSIVASGPAENRFFTNINRGFVESLQRPEEDS